MNTKSFDELDLTSEILEQITKSNDIQKLQNQNVLTRIQIGNVRQKKIRSESNLCSIFLVDSFKSIYESFLSILPETFNFKGLFLIVLTNEKSFNFSNAFELFWRNHIYNVNIMHQNKSAIIVETFIPFAEGKCNNTNSSVINVFKNGNFVYETQNFFPSKLKDLKNCSINIGISQNRPYVIQQYLRNKTYRLIGREVEIVEHLSRSINFHPQFNFSVGGTLFENGSATGSIDALLTKNVDFIIADYSLKMLRMKFMDSSVPYYSSQIGFAISPRPKLSSFENLFRPFDNFVWLAVTVLFATGIFVVFVINRSRKARDLFYGENVTTPFLNMSIAVFGGSQPIEPKGNFARILLMCFIIFCLVLRTLYQSSLFKFLQLLDQKDFQTIDELIENKYKIYSSAANFDLFPKESKIYSSLALVDYVQMEEVITQLQNENSKSALLRSVQGILFLNQENHKSKQKFKILKEFYATIPSVIYFNKNFFLIESINHEIGKLQSSGLIEYWHNIFVNKMYSSLQSLNSPKQLNLEHLGGGFQLCLIGWILSFLVFIVELIYKKKLIVI